MSSVVEPASRKCTFSISRSISSNMREESSDGYSKADLREGAFFPHRLEFVMAGTRRSSLRCCC